MDPNTALENALRAAQAIISAQDSDAPQNPEVAERLAESFMALHGWMSNGGFIPAEWRKNRR